MNLAVIFVFLLLLISLYGYYLMIKKSKLEKEIRDNKLDYSCFRCKKVISIDDKKCPNCEFVTIFGNRKKIGKIDALKAKSQKAPVLFRFFQLIPPQDFLFGLEWNPQFEGAERAGSGGGTATYGMVPMFVGTPLAKPQE